MSNLAYYTVWLVAGLGVIAIISALITRHLRQRVARRLMAIEAVHALDRYSEWVAAQRRSAFVQAEADEANAPLGALRAMGRQMPDLSPATEELFAVYGRLSTFLSSQQALRLHDPEAWLDSDHDAKFIEFWRQHLAAANGLEEKLRRIADEHDAQPEHGTGYPA